ncbi:MAG: hypothetical protein R6U68_08350, partial [Desulfobacteraceae bacterium]
MDIKKLSDVKPELSKKLQSVSSDLDIALLKLRAQLASLKVRKLSLEKRIEFINAGFPDDETISAWCADLTEDLTGTVGLIEVPGESVEFNIRPGYEGGATYDQGRDGQLVPTVIQTPAQAYYNLAMLPGWQKWMPTYRYATIDSLDTDADTA